MQQLKDEILEPAKAFPHIAEVYSENVDEYFADLVKQSNVDIATNNETCKVIYQKEAQLEKLRKQNKGNKAGKGFAAFFATCGFILFVVGVVFLALVLSQKQSGIPLGQLVLPLSLLIGGAILGVAMTLIICLVINKKIKQGDLLIQKLEPEIKTEKDKAWEQMSSLNNMFTWNMPQHLINETLPLIHLDRIFNPKRFNQLIDEYDYNPDNSPDESIDCVQSGQIEGNPFLFMKTFYTWMGTKVYTGSITITWTETVRDSNGWHTVTRSQVLTASLTKPYPFYGHRTDLIYGNGGAPNLTFIRQCGGKDASKMNEKQLAKYVRRQNKKLDKKAEKATIKGEGYTKAGSDEFEALFNCTNRNNEVEYRLLFTPLGQKNMIELLKSKPYGDDFDFVKDGKINIIHSKHSQLFRYHAAPNIFYNFDYEKIEEFFKSYCKEYLQSVFFDLAPLISIPEYVLNKPKSYIWKDANDNYNLTYHEIESLCNYYGATHFAHPSTASGVILKCQFNNKQDAIDNATIHAYSYQAIQHVDHIPMHGGDGHTHLVPVVWYEYRPLERKTGISVCDKNSLGKDAKFDSIYEQKGLGLSI